MIDERTKEESDYMRYGTPVDVGECAREVENQRDKIRYDEIRLDY